MRVLDLFAGIGGFSLAAHWMGWTTTAFVERDKFCQKVLRKNFGQDIEIHDDILNFSGKPFRDRIDIITGGFPCQPFSQAGQRRGVNDERHLFPEALRIVREVQPDWIVLENVNGLVSMANESRDIKMASHFFTRTPNLHDYQAVFTRTEIMLLDRICEAIECEDYAVQPIVVPASAIGAWHERKRIWLIANTNSGRHKKRQSGTNRQQRGSRRDARSEPSPPCFCSNDSNTNSTGSQGRNGKELLQCAVERVTRSGGSFVSDTTSERLPNWSNGALGRPFPITEFERPSGREVERDFRGVAHGVSARVDRIRSLGNSIVPQVAFEIFKAIETSRT